MLIGYARVSTDDQDTAAFLYPEMRRIARLHLDRRAPVRLSSHAPWLMKLT